MRTRKASAIIEAFRTAMARDSHAVEAWLKEEFANLLPEQRRDPKAVEDLIWVRAALSEALKEKKRRGRKAKKTNAKKKPAP